LKAGKFRSSSVKLACDCGDSITFISLHPSNIDVMLDAWDTLHSGHEETTFPQAANARRAIIERKNYVRVADR
jgi:hypothetical protein